MNENTGQVNQMPSPPDIKQEQPKEKKKDEEFSIKWHLKVLAVIYVILGILYIILKIYLK